MKKIPFASRIVLATLLFVLTTGFSSGQETPRADGKEVVATVNGEPVTLKEFREVLEISQDKDHSRVLNRLVDMRLILQEARAMGLGELPEIRERVVAFSKKTRREMLMLLQLKDVKADEAEVEKLSREVKIKTVFFSEEDDAKKMREEIRAGGDFDETAKKFVEEGKAQRSEEEEREYYQVQALQPQIAEAAEKMEVGSIGPVIPVEHGFTFFQIEDIRVSEDPEVRERAEREVLKRKRIEKLRNFRGELRDKYVTVHQDILDGLDFGSYEEFQRMLEDERIVAEVKGGKPVTVGDLANAIKQEIFHGVEKAVEGNKLDEKKMPTLYRIIDKRVYNMEALRVGVDKMDDYQSRVAEHEDSLIFGAFIAKVVNPDVTLSMQELKTYYDEHAGEYLFPEKMSIDSIVFSEKGDAEAALDGLGKGTDFRWLKVNAEGQVDRDAAGLMNFEREIPVKELPEGVRKVVSGARTGDSRLYADPGGHFYVLFIQNAIPPRQRPFEEVAREIAEIVYADKRNKVVEDWADNLRKSSEVKIYLKKFVK